MAYGEEASKVQTDSADRIIEATHRIIIPGLIDAHLHFYGILVPALIDHLPLDMRMPHLGAITSGWHGHETRVATLLGALRIMRNGTTTVLENVVQGIEATAPAIHALLDSGLRAVVGPMIADRSFHETMPGYLERLPKLQKSRALNTPTPSGKELLDLNLALAREWHGREGRIYI